MKFRPRLILKLALPALILSSMACSTTPAPRVIRFEVEWIRSTLDKENYAYRHSERMAPLIDGNMLFQGNGSEGVSALDRKTGRELWRMNIHHGVESGMAVEGDSLFFGASDGQFYGVEKITGKTLWAFPTRAENLAAPLVTDGVVYFLAGNNILYALDSKTGKQLWVYNRGETSSLSIRGGSKPALYKGTLYVGFSDGYLVALNSKEGSLIWERKLNTNPKFVDVDAGPVVDENNIWVSSFDGALFCLSRADGQIQWRLDDGGSTTVVIDGDNLYYSSLNENVYSLNKKTGAVKWKYNYPEKYGIPTQPTLFKGLVIFGASDGNLTALSETTGQVLASYQPGSGVFATPQVDNDGNVYVFSNEANLHALKVQWRRNSDKYEMPPMISGTL